jgi:hypothetical protein
LRITLPPGRWRRTIRVRSLSDKSSSRSIAAAAFSGLAR